VYIYVQADLYAYVWLAITPQDAIGNNELDHSLSMQEVER